MSKPLAPNKRYPTPRRTDAASRLLTHEAIDAHLAAFKKSGGRVEVLGPTPTFKHIGFQSKVPAKE